VESLFVTSIEFSPYLYSSGGHLNAKLLILALDTGKVFDFPSQHPSAPSKTAIFAGEVRSVPGQKCSFETRKNIHRMTNAISRFGTQAKKCHFAVCLGKRKKILPVSKQLLRDWKENFWPVPMFLGDYGTGSFSPKMLCPQNAIANLRGSRHFMSVYR
jgi:hypothetical protein